MIEIPLTTALISKECQQCHVEKTIQSFQSRPRNSDGFEKTCKECINESRRGQYAANSSQKLEYINSWRKRNPEKVKQYNIKYRYGLDSNRYEAMIELGCAVCRTTENLCVDHDRSCCSGERSCGKCIRGVLCSSHNIGAGHFSNSDEVRKLAEYLESHERKEG